MDAAEKLVRPTKERLRKAGDNFERIVVDIDAYGRKIPVEIFRMLDGSTRPPDTP
jgi:hypothetical protein